MSTENAKVEIFCHAKSYLDHVCQNVMNFAKSQMSFIAKEVFDSVYNEDIKDATATLLPSKSNQGQQERVQNYLYLCRKFKYPSLNLVLKLSNEYILCHSFILLSCPKIAAYLTSSKCQLETIPAPKQLQANLTSSFKSRQFVKKSLDFHLLDLSGFSSVAVRSVVNIFYTGILRYPKSEKMNVYKLVKNFDLETGVLMDLYDLTVKNFYEEEE